MKVKMLLLLFTFGIIFNYSSTPVHAFDPEIPNYAKWGRLAMQETHKRYPNMKIVDYLHVGREDVDQNTARETFKLWLKEDSKEFGVYVVITFNKRTERVQNIRFIEVPR